MSKLKIYFTMLISMVVIASCSKDKFDANAQMAIDEELIKKHIATNNIPATKHTSGLYYQIITPGTGKTISSSSTVYVQYIGKLLSGTTFQEQTGSTVPLNLGETIKGWQIGIPLIKEGGQIRLIIPSPLAYGKDSPSASIPAKSVLDFTIYVSKVQ